MKDAPIIFSGPMVRAILEGRKTQTRRLCKDRLLRQLTYSSGQLLWVRENWQDYCPTWQGAWCGCGSQEMIRRTHRPAYAATPDERGKPLRWKPSIYMPRWASRITLEVEAVKVERLFAISRSDVLAEGVPAEAFKKWEQWLHKDDCPASAFGELWDSVHGKGAWALNPWVTAITFKPILKNIDKVIEEKIAA